MSIDQNDGSAKSSSNDVKQGFRLLIDAYGGNNTSHEKLPKVQRLNAYQGMTNLQCNEEDMYAWKNMSHILAIQGKELKLGPPRPNVGSNRENAALPEKEFKTSRTSQPFLSRPDICANDLLKMQLLTYVWGPQFEQCKYTNRQRLYLYEQIDETLISTGDQASLIDQFRARAREIKEQGRGAAVTADEVAAIYSSLLLVSLRTESKQTITTELSIVADQQLRHAEGIARAICEWIILKVFYGTYTKANTSLQASVRHLFLTGQPHSSSVLGRIEDELQFSSKENENPAKPARSSHPSCGLHVNAKYLEASHQSEQPTIGVGLFRSSHGVLESMMVLT